MASVWVSKRLKVAGAITMAGLLLLLLLSVIVPFLPPLHPLTSQLLTRLREAGAFLAFTTAIAVGILSTQHKGVQQEKQKSVFLENHPLGSIFGESGYADSDPSTPDYFSARNNGSMPLLSSEAIMGTSHTEFLRALMVANGTVEELKSQRKLHRKSSSLDNSVNYEPELHVAETKGASHVRTTSNEQGVFTGNKPTKRVSFSLASSPSSPQNIAGKSGRDSSETRDFSASSPGDLTGQADAFIAKFKEQLRMQRLESFKRNQRRL